MAKINLRPWREELRNEKKRDFAGLAVGTVIAAAVVAFGWQEFVSGEIAAQDARNSYIGNAMVELDRKIKEIEELRKKREELLARMKVIQDLQGKRPVIVRVFDEMVQTLPDGLYYTQLNKADKNLTIIGMAESNNRISTLMRSLSASEWFANPNLTSVSSADGRRAGYNQFTLSVQQRTPEEKQAGQAEK